MKLFDKISEDGDEVEIDSSAVVAEEDEEVEESRLRREVEDEVGSSPGTDTGSPESSDSGLPGVDYGSSGSGSSSETSASSKSYSSSTGSSTGSSSGTSSSLPGVSTDKSSSKSSCGIDLEDIHSQNKEIIELLEDIRSKVGGGGNQLL